MRALKWILLGVGALAVLVAAGVAILVATFDPNDYKPRLVELVKQQTGRTLTLDGRIELTLFPRIGAAFGKATLSEPHGAAIFARVDEARVGVALFPLLSRQVVVDRVTLRGLTLDLVRRKDGRTNFDDLTGQASPPAPPGKTPAPAPAGSPLAVEVGGIAIENAGVRWRDERDGTDVRLSGVTLKMGRLANGARGRLELLARIDGAQPKARLDVTVETGYRMDLAAPAVALSSLDAKVAGDAPGLTGVEAHFKADTIDLDPKAPRATLSRVELVARSKDGLDAKVLIPRVDATPDRLQSQPISADISLAAAGRSIAAKVQLSAVTATPKQVSLSQLGVDFNVKQADLGVAGKLGAGVAVDVEHRQAELRGIAADLTVTGTSLPAPSKGTVKGAARADWGAERASGELAIRLDDSSIDATASVVHWADPAITFSLVADRLDVDRYLPPSKPRAKGDSARGGAASGGPAGAPPAETPIDLSALRGLNATGTVKVGALQASNVKAEQVALTVRAAGGKLDVDPISAVLYEGTLAGAATASARDMRFTARHTLTGVKVGPLLHDLADTDVLEGRGVIAFDLGATGTTVSALKKALAGTASLAIKDGALRGVDLDAIVRLASALLASKKSKLEQPGESGARTEFADLAASFAIARGVAHNEDLVLKSALLRATGRGDIDIGEDRIDYTAKASVVAPPSGQGSKELAQIAGVVVPVRVTGSLAKPTYTVDLGGVAADLARRTLQQEIERRLAPGKPGSQERSGDAIGDALRGLFGKPK